MFSKRILLPLRLSLIHICVLEKGTTNGTITDLDGRFTLSIGKGTELIVSYVGYTPKTVKIGNQSTIKIVLIEDTKTCLLYTSRCV